MYQQNRQLYHQQQSQNGRRHVIKLRGLPWTAREEQVRQFFHSENPLRILITFLDNGKASGEGYVEFRNQQDLENAKLKNKKYMGKRYVEIFLSSGADYDKALRYQTSLQNKKFGGNKMYQNQNKRQQGYNNNTYGTRPNVYPNPPYVNQNVPYIHNQPLNHPRLKQDEEKKYVIRIRGLPFDVKENEIYEFFGKIPIRDIVLLTNKQNTKKLTGEGFIFLKNEIDLRNTKKLDNKFINKRYIEIFPSDIHEFEKETKHNNKYSFIKYNKDPNETKCLHVNGLPNNVTEQQISDFFSDKTRDITPWKIYRKTKGSEAYIEFHTIDDCNYAESKKNKYFPNTRNTIRLQKVPYDKLADTIGLNN